MLFTRGLSYRGLYNSGRGFEFLTKRAEILGEAARIDPLANYFLHNIAEERMCDVETICLMPTSMSCAYL